LGGLLGSLFINVNTRMGRLRKRFVNTKWKKIVECGLFAAMSVSIMFWTTAWLNKCIPRKTSLTALDLLKKDNEDELEGQNDWICDSKNNMYSPVATLFFNTERGMIKALFKADENSTNFETLNIFAFGAIWFVLTITTYGVWIPAGLFLPGIIMGGALGRLYTNIVQVLFNQDFDPDVA